MRCRSCKAVVEASSSVSLNRAAIEQFAQQLDAAAVKEAAAKPRLVFPISLTSLSGGCHCACSIDVDAHNAATSGCLIRSSRQAVSFITHNQISAASDQDVQAIQQPLPVAGVTSTAHLAAYYCLQPMPVTDLIMQGFSVVACARNACLDSGLAKEFVPMFATKRCAAPAVDAVGHGTQLPQAVLQSTERKENIPCKVCCATQCCAVPYCAVSCCAVLQGDVPGVVPPAGLWQRLRPAPAGILRTLCSGNAAVRLLQHGAVCEEVRLGQNLWVQHEQDLRLNHPAAASFAACKLTHPHIHIQACVTGTEKQGTGSTGPALKPAQPCWVCLIQHGCDGTMLLLLSPHHPTQHGQQWCHLQLRQPP